MHSGLIPLNARNRPPGLVERTASGSSVMNRRLGIGREGGIGGRSAQQVQRSFDRFIVRLIGKHKALNLPVPQSLQATADEAIE